MNRQRQDSWTSIKTWLCYSGHRVALVVHRAQKSVPNSAGEWPTFLPPPLESCSGTANVDGPNSHEVFIHIHQGCFTGTGEIVKLLQCQWSKPDGYGKISHCITTTKHSKAKTVCIFLGIYCTSSRRQTRSQDQFNGISYVLKLLTQYQNSRTVC